MTRTYSDLVDQSIQALLYTIANKNTEPAVYQETMTKLGMILGQAVLSQISNEQCNVYLACTVEDADFLARGMLICLEEHLQKVAFACFWNWRFSPFEIEDLKVTPIIRKYQEPVSQFVHYLIVVKSIVSSACVVRINAVNLIQKSKAEKIVILDIFRYFQAEEGLKSSFDKSIYEKFNFFYFAKDNEVLLRAKSFLE